MAEARRAWTTLSMYGYRVDGVVVNRVFPEEGADEWRRGWVEAQREVLAEVRDSFGELTRWTSPYRAREPLGVDALHEVARELYAESDPFAPAAGSDPFRVEIVPGGGVLHLALPWAARDEVDLARSADVLVITHGSYRRVLTLPSVLARMQVRGAGVTDGELRVRFVEEET